MKTTNRSRISFRQAFYLALIVLAIYYPISIYVNIPPENILQAARYLILPAFIAMIFYVLLIIATDRIIDWTEDMLGNNFLTGLRIHTVLLSIPFAVLATLFSQFLFSYSFMLAEWVKEFAAKEEISKKMEFTAAQLESWRRTNNGLTMVTVLSITYLILNRKANSKMKNMEVREEQLKKENALAQYEALKNQISPHFLFNSLSILSSLVHVDPNLSESFIDQLSRAYRYILEQKDNDSTSLQTELSFIKSYAFLLKIRFEDKFDLRIDISDEDAVHYKIAPLTLQLLVENGVKHNRMSNKEPLLISVFIDGSYLLVRNIIKDRHENEVMPSTGIGLKNIINRYKLLTTKPVVVSQEEEVFTVKIPLFA